VSKPGEADRDWCDCEQGLSNQVAMREAGAGGEAARANLVTRAAFAPPRLALDDVVDVEVLDRGWPVSEAELRAGRQHLFGPRLSLVA
jgi:hypothetical protein